MTRSARSRLASTLLVSIAMVAAACGSSAGTTQPTASPTPSPTAGATTPASANAPSNTVWLCKPGLPNDPCTTDLTTTVVQPNGSSRVEKYSADANAPIDCFYVYPTVSRQKTTNATLTIDPEERAVAIAQVAQLSRVCRVFAPMYPQLTLEAIAQPETLSPGGALVAYSGVSSAFADYLAHYNHGRGFVLVGHSQGAFLLDALVKIEVDPRPDVRRRLVSAILLGGDVAVKTGADVGGDFTNIPACRTSDQTGCVVAYSSYAATPPANARFGRIATSLNPERRGAIDMQILCVNPTSPAGGTGGLVPIVPTAGILDDVAAFSPGPSGGASSAKTPFVAYPGELTATCHTATGVTWLQVDRAHGVSNSRIPLAMPEGVSWGLHRIDVNVALGNLVELVRAESVAYARQG